MEQNGHVTETSMVIVENGEEIVKVNKMQMANGGSQPLNGPDQVLPADDYVTWIPEGRVKLRLAPRGIAGEPPISVPGLLRQTAARYPDSPALCTKKDGKWHKITYTQYLERVRTVAKAFLKLGLERFHSVCILGFNSEQWFVADLAAIHAGGYAAGVYTTNSAEACLYCLEKSRANICAVQDKKQLDKILSVRHKCPTLKAIIQWEGPVDSSVPGLYSSGTVGPPKAVMLSHDSLTWDAYSISQRVGDIQPTVDTLISFLPLSHVAAQVVDIYVTLMNAVTVYFAQPDALKGSLIDTLKDVRPTRLLAVPRLWEKMYEKMMAVGAQSGSLKKCIAVWAKEKGLKYHLGRIEGALSAGMRGLPIEFTTLQMLQYWRDGMTLSYKMARSLVFSKVRENLGLDRCVTFVTAAAPLSADIKKFFLSLDIPIMEAFGMSEGSGAHSLSIDPKFNLTSVGELLEGTETKFEGSMSQNGPGEILMRGRHVFMGYLGDEEKTRATIDSEGWLHSGDVGRVDSHNFLYITGRIKELLITAGGENVAPVLIEQTVQAELPHVGYAVLIGDRRKFLSILLTLKCKVDNESGDPLDELDPVTQKWVESLGSKATSLREISKTKDPLVSKAIEAGIMRANKQAISNAQKIQKFSILPADFSVNTGELGPTLKIKRNVVYEKYHDIIEDFYKD
ncbi:long-chain-fatty-acid--CoA ligase ACSBG2 isoform X4 [Cydia pomonella]|uniref:long-chain-fatty-acid--CoA ligase ACSBG2 isoform X4 n=1 Tax=Cydia pomonella TaxID=82600 RepID=UPI002ADD5910|nr:long-chain-fatty-acid--CoA ligase ACSBG2 isoform X4 [Cydia pomonella]